MDFITVRNATPEECAAFGIEVMPINWAVILRGEVAAIFQAEDDGDNWLNVHAHVKRRTLHPSITYLYAHLFSTQLLQKGATGLKAEIEPSNRAAVRVAKAAGFTEVHRNECWITLKREPNGQEEKRN